jgi:hypothetical protein
VLDELLPDELLPDELPELPDESSEPESSELPESDDPEESSSASSELPEPELPASSLPPEPPVPPPDGLSAVGGGTGIDPASPVVALPDAVPPAGLVDAGTGPMNTPSTPSWRSGLQLSAPSRSSAESCEQVTVSMVPGVAATATPCGRKAAALMTAATATGRHTFCPYMCAGPPDDLEIGPRVDSDAGTA